MVHCNILLENNVSAVYFAGETIKGTVELHVDQPRQFRGRIFYEVNESFYRKSVLNGRRLYMKVFGFAQCQWTERETRSVGVGNNQRTTHHTANYEGKHVYIDDKSYLFGNDQAPAVEVPSGVHRYDFALQLPPMLPASLEAPKGHIRYDIEAVLDIPWSYDKEFKLQFTLVRNEDLSLDPQLRLPVDYEEIRTFCCFFCKSQPIILTVCLPRTGYTAGEYIPISINYVNKSDVDASRTKINLKQMIRYKSQTPMSSKKIEEEKMSETFVDGVKAESSVSYQKSLHIPHAVMVSNAKYCEIIQVSYELKVEAITAGWGDNPKVKIPITIGTYSLSPVRSGSNASFIRSISSAPVSNQKATTDLPTPTYNEIVNSRKGSQDLRYQHEPSSPGWNNLSPTAPIGN